MQIQNGVQPSLISTHTDQKISTPSKTQDVVSRNQYTKQTGDVQISQKTANSTSASVRAVDQFEQMAREYGLKKPSEKTSAQSSKLIELAPIKIFNAADVKDYEKRLSDAFAKAGIDTSQEIKLGTDYEGRVIVKNDHPDKSKIEALFVEDRELRNGFVQTSTHYQLKELYRLNQEWAQKIESGVDEYTAGQWLLQSAQQTSSVSAKGLTFHEGKMQDPFETKGVSAVAQRAYGL